MNRESVIKQIAEEERKKVYEGHASEVVRGLKTSHFMGGANQQILDLINLIGPISCGAMVATIWRMEQEHGEDLVPDCSRSTVRRNPSSTLKFFWDYCRFLQNPTKPGGPYIEVSAGAKLAKAGPQFVRGAQYTRPQIKEAVGAPPGKGGNWDVGVVRFKNDFFIFANVGVTGKTGHDYPNRWEGDRFRWFHQEHSHLGWETVVQLLDPARAVHIFWRPANFSPFTYAGLARAIEVTDTTPVEVLWSLSPADAGAGSVILRTPEEVVEPFGISEGGVTQVLVNRYERNPEARERCIKHYGNVCQVCGVSFEKVYGPIGAGFIHVHHLTPLSEIGAEYTVDPIKDLRPVCPNCHAMLHRKKPTMSIEALRARIKGTHDSYQIDHQANAPLIQRHP